jgi:hypothetical protein
MNRESGIPAVYLNRKALPVRRGRVILSPKMNRASDLKEYRKLLAQAEHDELDAAKRVRAYKQIVAGLETLSEARSIPGVRLFDETETVSERTASEPLAEQLPAGPRIRRAKRGLPAILRRLMADGEARNVRQVLGLLALEDEYKDVLPARTTVSNRLNELGSAGYLKRVGRGTYQLATQDGSAPSVEATGSEKAESDSRVIRDDDEGLGKRTAQGA